MANIELYNTLVGPACGARPLLMGFAGDSMAGYATGANGTVGAFEMTQGPFLWSLMRDHYGDVILNGKDVSLGGYSTAVGGTSSDRLIDTQLPQWQAMAVKPDIAYVRTLQNDYINTKAKAEHFAGNCTAFATALLAMGVGAVILVSKPPKTLPGDPDLPNSVFYCNRIMEEFCRVTPGAYFENYFPLVHDGDSAVEFTGVLKWKGTNGGADGYSNDGTHASLLSDRAEATLLTPILKRLAPRIALPRSGFFQGYDTSINPLGNIIGRGGMMIGTTGSKNGVANAGVAGDGFQAQWALTDGNSAVATPSIITHADGYKRQRLTLSGTCGAGGSTTTLSMVYYPDVLSGPTDFEAMLDFTGVSGVAGWSVEMDGGSGAGAYFSSGGGYLPNGITESLFLRTLSPFTFANSGGSTRHVTMNLVHAAGAVLAGTVDFGRIFAGKQA